MSFLAALLSGSQNQISTRQALMVVGLQNDFTSPEGKLPVNTATGYLEKIRELVPAFREHGEIFWITTQYRGKRSVNNPSGSGCMVVADDGFELPLATSDDEMTGLSSRPSLRSNRRTNQIVQRTMNRAAAELQAESSSSGVDKDLFLSQDEPEENCCLPGSWGAELSPEVRDLVSPKDVQIVKSYYSAFTSSSLLLMLRAKLITEVYVVGCTTNLSVYATALDAAQHGLSINLVEDCLNYRLKDRHDRAVQKLVEIMGASVTTSASVLSRLKGETQTDESSNEAGTGNSDVDMEDQPGAVREPFPANDFERHFESLRLNDDESVTAGDRKHTPPKHTEPASPQLSDTPNHRRHPSSKSAGLRRRHDDTQNKSIKPESRIAQSATEAALHELSQGLVNRVLSDDTSSLTKRPSSKNTHVEHGSHSAATNLQTQREVRPSHRSRNIVERMMERVQKGEEAEPTVTQPTRVSRKAQMRRKDLSVLGPSDPVGSGDSNIVYDLLEPAHAKSTFQDLFTEVRWQHMYHAAGEVPRLVCCQGDIDPTDGSMPVYRHPADQSLPLLHWSPTVIEIKKRAEERVGHELNHVLIQLYRSGQDHISEHSDKTLDIVHGSKIANVSFGAQRTMRLRTKRPITDQGQTTGDPNRVSTARTDDQTRARMTQRIPLPHNSMFVMGLKTNESWLHGIMPDKRPLLELSPAESAYGNMRISLTFRQIGTFLSSDSRLIWGQGAVRKQKKKARPTINRNLRESKKLINAFGFENQSTVFDWDETYGSGSDVLHLKSELPENEKPMMFLSGQSRQDAAVEMYLSHHQIETDIIAPPTEQLTGDMKDADGVPLSILDTRRRSICFRQANHTHTQIEGKIAILEFLQGHYAKATPSHEQSQRENQAINYSQTLAQLEDPATAAEALQKTEQKLEEWEREKVEPRRQNDWFAGPGFGVADCLYWPLVRECRKEVAGSADWFPRLERWAAKMEDKLDIRDL